MTKFFFGMAIISALIGMVGFWVVLIESNGAPQEAAGAALILAFAIPPYIIARILFMSESRDKQNSGSE